MVDEDTSKPARGNLEQVQLFAGWIFILLLTFLVPFIGVRAAWSQQPPPPPPKGRPGPPRLDAASVADHIERIRRRLTESRLNGADDETLIAEARRVLSRSEGKLRANEIFAADRLAAACDALLDATEHPQHPKQGPSPPVPSPPDIAEHLQHVYFRLQQADFFAQTSGDPGAKQLRGLARRFYERALQAYDKKDWLVADKYAKSSDDTIRGLENLAQAATPLPPRPR